MLNGIRQGKYGNFPYLSRPTIPYPTPFNFLNGIEIRIILNKRMRLGWGVIRPEPILLASHRSLFWIGRHLLLLVLFIIYFFSLTTFLPLGSFVFLQDSGDLLYIREWRPKSKGDILQGGFPFGLVKRQNVSHGNGNTWKSFS